MEAWITDSAKAGYTWTRTSSCWELGVDEMELEAILDGDLPEVARGVSSPLR